MEKYGLSLEIIDKIEKKKYQDFSILRKDSICKSDEELKCYLIHNKKIENKCNSCKIEPKWNNKPLDFVLVRKNKKKLDNRLENLIFLCPNCFFQNSKKSIYEDINKSKMAVCIDCKKRFKRKKEKTSLNPRHDVIEKQIKHKFVKLRCNYCMQRKVLSDDDVTVI
tara:strand:+ start:1075 stop:1572 length:498 start_codon:yes stop_codon:yes gene_type:complete